MADLLPKFKVTDPHSHAESPQDSRDIGKLSNKGEGTNGRLAASVRSPTSPSGQSSDVPNGTGSDGRISSEAAIDPLSQQILKRTNTSPARQKLRVQGTDPQLLHDATPDKTQSGETPRDLSAGARTDKR
ncbi:hypothetical protein B5807_10687 [Epicoccum nigrum]|uniref:Uncharacterized protein n=1 Tax=Epicoccum nigrum TaxID=105696 RepID=A0A1Y2LLL5_EPING|nr:hypothetical protein B5807_10687 [Epicoccum nigrum]